MYSSVKTFPQTTPCYTLRVNHLPHWVLGFVLGMSLGFGGVPFSSAQAETKLTIVPFVPVKGKAAAVSSIPAVSKKMGRLLKSRGFAVVGATKDENKKTFVLPNRSAYNEAMSLFTLGKNLMRKKKYEPAKDKLEGALRSFHQGMVHVRDFNQFLELYRLMGLCFFRLGLGEQGEQAINRLGALAPKRKYAVSKMPPAMRRVLQGAQRRARRGKGSIRIMLPEGSSVQFNDKILSNASSPLVIKGLAPGKHYLWVRKSGFIPFAEPVVIRGSRATKLSVSLERIPQTGGADFSAQIGAIHSSLRSGLVNARVRRNVQSIASSLKVNYVMFGYFERQPTANRLSMFIYRRSDGALKAYPPIPFDVELLMVDIKLIKVANAIKAKMGSYNSLPNKAWDTGTAPVAKPEPRAGDVVKPTPRPNPTVAVAKPQTRPNRLAQDDPSLDGVDDDDDDGNIAGGMKVVQPRPRPRPQPKVAVVQPRPQPRPAVVEPRPQPRPAVVEPRPQPRPKPVIPGGDDDDDDVDSISKTRKPVVRPRPRPEPRPAAVEPRPEPRPAAVEPRPEPRPAVVEPRPRPAAVEPPPVRKPRRVARVPRVTPRPRRSGKFDADVDVDWSNPIPRIARDSAYREKVLARRRVRRVRTPVVEDPPPIRRPKPRPEPVSPKRNTDDDDSIVRREPPPRRRSDSWGGGDNDGGAIVRRPPPRRPTGPTPITKKWWFWTAIVGGVAVAGGVTAAIVATSPSNAYNVFVNINQPE
ncbi:MAG: hypothetical protein EP343_09765 [Deltaproteobacteria bacterium]|nr:MAG: hypothetical protein EP343_09765 [Deltaproteobacteria bacterium]